VASLAPLLLYPTDGLEPRVAECRQLLEAREPELFQLVAASLSFLAEKPRFELEELYTQTFDLNPVCTLEVGWHLYGEQYERGRFLVRAREMLSAVGQDEGGELPDFLPTLLSALARMGETEAVDLAAYVLPAVGKMCEALADKQKSHPYLGVLRAVRQALTVRVPAGAVETIEGRYRPHLRPQGRAPKQDLVQLGSPGGRSARRRAQP
jgi:nitrate reductase delta subunit